MRYITAKIDLYEQFVNLLHAKQGDDTVLQLTIYEHYIPFDFKECKYNIIYNLSHDVAVIQYTAIISNGNILTISIPNAVVAVSGDVLCELRIYRATKQISTYIFRLFVAPALISGQTIDGDTNDKLISALALSTQAPYIGDNGNWRIYNNETGTFVDSGVGAVADGDTNYNNMINKPSIENTVLVGNKELPEIGVNDLTNMEIEAIINSFV